MLSFQQYTKPYYFHFIAQINMFIKTIINWSKELYILILHNYYYFVYRRLILHNDLFFLIAKHTFRSFFSNILIPLVYFYQTICCFPLFSYTAKHLFSKISYLCLQKFCMQILHITETQQKIEWLITSPHTLLKFSNHVNALAKQCSKNAYYTGISRNS